MAQEVMEPGFTNSPSTIISSDISSTDDIIPVVELGVLADAPNKATLGSGALAETIHYTGKSAASGAGNLTGVTRAYDTTNGYGVAQSWDNGTQIRRWITKKDFDEFANNINDHELRVAQTELFFSTGVLTGGEVTRLSDNSIRVASGSGFIADLYSTPGEASITKIIWEQQDVTLESSDLANILTYIYINGSGSAIKNTRDTPSLRRDYIQVGAAIHPAGVVVETNSQTPILAYDGLGHLTDLWKSIGYIKTGFELEAYSTNLQLEINAGSVSMLGINFDVDSKNSNNKTFSAISPVASALAAYRDGSGGYTLTSVSAIDPTKYDDGSGTLQTVLNNQATAQMIYWSPKSGQVYFIYGQKLYTSLNDCKADYAINIKNLTLPDELSSAVFLGWVLITGGTTDLTASTASIISSDKFCQMSGAGGSGSSAGVASDGIWNATGDLAVGTGNDSASVLSLGDAGKYLKSNGTTLEYSDPLASPTLTGTPTAPTAPIGTDTTQIATTAFVQDEIIDRFFTEGLYRNAVINGNFDIWQRGTDGVYAGETGAFTADRWEIFRAAWSRQLFTPGQSDVPNNPQYYIRFDTSGGTGAQLLRHRIENVRTLSGGSGTLSFWARADQEITTETFIRQFFGSGGSAQVETSYVTNLTTSWQQFVFPHVFPSVAGKTIGDGNCIELHLCRFNNLDALIDIAQVQLNIGDKPLPFAPRPYAEELALCRWYFERIQPESSSGSIALGYYRSSTQFYGMLYYSPKRTAPSLTFSAADTFILTDSGAGTTTVLDISSGDIGSDRCRIDCRVASATQHQMARLRRDVADTTYIDISAEL